MLSQSASFDIPQNSLPVNHGFYLDALNRGLGGHENQQIRMVPHEARLDVGAGDRVLSYVYDHAQPKKDFTEQLRILHQHYTILDADSVVTKLIEMEPVLYFLLIEAVEPLKHAFGEKRIVHVRVQSSDEDSILKVAIQLPADFAGDAEHALRSFDKEWWLNNCHRSGGTLVFDYEMQDAI